MDLALILEELYEARSKWYNIGLNLGLQADTLDAIKEENSSSECFREMLKTWLQCDLERSWKALAKALGGKAVGRPDIAKKIETKT